MLLPLAVLCPSPDDPPPNGTAFSQAFDPSLLRESMVFDSFRAMGVCTQRKSYAGVYINGEFWGLYLMAEIIDESFVGANWGSSEVRHPPKQRERNHRGGVGGGVEERGG